MINKTSEQKKTRKKININFLARVSAKEKIFFLQNLKTMLKAGMSLGESLRVLSKQTQNVTFKKILTEITTDIEKGQSLSTAMSRHSKHFSEIFINMISAGETSGNLENILEQLYIQTKKDHDLISKIRGAMTYPAVVLFAMVIMGFGMIIFVFPTFIQIFEEANAELPFITKILIAVSNFIQHHGIIAFVLTVAFAVGFSRGIKTKIGKKYFDLFLLKFFIIGPIVKKVNLARFARSLNSLLKTEIPLIKSFEITANVVGNTSYKEAINKAREEIKKGAAISSSLEVYANLFPSMLIQMIMVGEKSGTTDELLGEIANYYEEEVDDTTRNLSSIIEPLMILIIGAAVGLMAVAVMMPMYNLAQQY
ncbi:MAG: type II secretion system F family protein [bacterium]